MPRAKKEKQNDAESKHDYKGFKGALNVPLNRKMESGRTLEEELSEHIGQVLDQELANQDKRISKLKDWENSYKGIKPPKSYPWPNCANVSVPITRSDTDAIHVRIADAVFNKRKLWMIRAKEPAFVGLDRKMEEMLDWFQRNVLKFQTKMQSPLLQCVKTGTGIVNIGWESKKRTVYRYATKKEIRNKKVPTYKLPGTDREAVTVVQSLYEGPQIYPISREDFVFSADAPTLEDAYLVGFRTYVRKPDIKLRKKQKMYRADPVDRLLQVEDKTPEVKEGRAEGQKKEIKYEVDLTKPLEVWELWFQYDVDEDGEPDDIVLTFHKETKEILRAVFNPMFLGFRPFVPLVFYPNEYSVDGEGVAEILENLQKEIDSLHNQRLDRLTQINSPVIFVRTGSTLEKLDSLEPGAIYGVDGELQDDIREFRWSDTTYSTHQEEDRLIAAADRAIGISPNVLGISTAERPVAKETFANIEEANKKFKFGMDNVRLGFNEIGYMLLEFFAQYQPTYSYTQAQTIKDKTQLESKNIQFPIEYIRDGLQVELMASNEINNQETRRQIHLTLYQLLSDYYSKTAGMVQVIIDPSAPIEFKKFLISIIQKGDDRLEKVMEDFDQVDGEKYLVNLEESVDIEAALAPPPPPDEELDEEGMPIEGGPPMPAPGGPIEPGVEEELPPPPGPIQ